MRVPSPAKGCALRVRGRPVSAQRDLCASFLEHDSFLGHIRPQHRQETCSLLPLAAEPEETCRAAEKGDFSWSQKSHQNLLGKVTESRLLLHTPWRIPSPLKRPGGTGSGGDASMVETVDETFLKGGLASLVGEEYGVSVCAVGVCVCFSFFVFSWLNWRWAQCRSSLLFLSA